MRRVRSVAVVEGACIGACEISSLISLGGATHNNGEAVYLLNSAGKLSFIHPGVLCSRRILPQPAGAAGRK